MLFIEVGGLKTEGVQIHILGTALPRFIFSQRQKAMPISATTLKEGPTNLSRPRMFSFSVVPDSAGWSIVLAVARTQS